MNSTGQHGTQKRGCCTWIFSLCNSLFCCQPLALPHQPGAGQQAALTDFFPPKKSHSCLLNVQGRPLAPANLPQQRVFREGFSQTNGHGRAMLAPTRVFLQPEKKLQAGDLPACNFSLSKNPIIKPRNTHPRLQKSKNISQKLASKGVSTPSLQAFSDSWQQN